MIRTRPQAGVNPMAEGRKGKIGRDQPVSAELRLQLKRGDCAPAAQHDLLQDDLQS